MPCSSPLQAVFADSPDGVRRLTFPPEMGVLFRKGGKLPDNCISLPCGQCMFCRLERSRENALRCLHESRLSDDNCFVTLTFSDEFLEKMCPLTAGGYSLVRKHAQDFMKRLREKFSRGFSFKNSDGIESTYKQDCIRCFGCGEYGDKSARPHYHFCLFGCTFPDRKLLKVRNGFRYYTSRLLSDLWPYGHSSVCDFSFETAAYVARYCTKKITGSKKVEHYNGRLPEFSIFPTRGGGLGKPWFDKYFSTDVMPTDSCIVNGVVCSVPRYYDKLRKRVDPSGLELAKAKRIVKAKLREEDNTFLRRQDKDRCLKDKVRLLKRSLDE